MEVPNPKHQIPNKFQLSEFETKSIWSFEIGIWSLSGIWNLWFAILDAMRYDRKKGRSRCLSMNIDVESAGMFSRGSWRSMRGETLWYAPIVERRNLRKSFPASLLQRDRNHPLPALLRVDRQDSVEADAYRWSTGFCALREFIKKAPKPNRNRGFWIQG